MLFSSSNENLVKRHKFKQFTIFRNIIRIRTVTHEHCQAIYWLKGHKNISVTRTYAAVYTRHSMRTTSKPSPKTLMDLDGDISLLYVWLNPINVFMSMDTIDFIQAFYRKLDKPLEIWCGSDKVRSVRKRIEINRMLDMHFSDGLKDYWVAADLFDCHSATW